jgi:hypothetical protein
MIQAPPPSFLEQLLGPVGRAMTPDFARELVELRASEEVQARIDELAEKCNEGQLSPDEHTEYEDYVRAIHLIGILQKKARKVLANGNES